MDRAVTVHCRRLLAVLLVCNGCLAAVPVSGEAASNHADPPGTAEGRSKLEEPSKVEGGSELAARSGAADDSVLFQGQVLFARNCSVGYCHGKGGRAGRGPRLRGRKLPADYLGRVIRDGIPNSTMGSWGDRMSEDEIASIVSFIQTLADLAPGDPDPVFGGGRYSAANVRRVEKNHRTGSGPQREPPASSGTPAGGAPSSSTPATITAAPTATPSAAGGRR